ncbi:MAG: hypothetical protein NVSMB38_42970 [Ktedonobacteraceae bacterium]
MLHSDNVRVCPASDICVLDVLVYGYVMSKNSVKTSPLSIATLLNMNSSYD